LIEFGDKNNCQTLSILKKGSSFYSKGEKNIFFGYQQGGSSNSGNDGVWARWEYKDGIFTFKNDKFGFYPIYYYAGSDRFIISTSLVKIIEIMGPQEIDCVAISVFLRTGYFIGDDTPFLNIKVPPPCCNLTWKNGLLDISSPEIKYQDCHLDRPEAIREYGRIFQCKIEKYKFTENIKVGLPLSGGRDSRHILFSLLRKELEPSKCVTMKHFPPKSDEDCKVASNLTNKLNLDHVIIDPSNDEFKVEIEKNIITNFCANQHAWLLPLAEYFCNNKFDIIYDGIAGDVLSTTVFSSKEKVKLYSESKFTDLAELILGSEGYLSSILSKNNYERWSRSKAIEHIVEELKCYVESPNPVSQFYFWNKTRRQTSLASWGILNKGVHVVAPFLDSDIFDFLSSLPVEYLYEGKCFHTEAILKYYPEYSKIPFEGEGMSYRNATYAEIVKYSISMARHILITRGKQSPVNIPFVIKRLMKGLIDKEYGTNLPKVMNIPIYLKQLSEYACSVEGN